MIVAVKLQLSIDPDRWVTEMGLLASDAETIADDVAVLVTDLTRSQLNNLGVPFAKGGGVAGTVLGVPRR